MERLDISIVNSKIIKSRSRAKHEIINGNIYVNGNKINKPSYLVKNTDKIELKGQTLKYVSKGGLKLEKAINFFNIEIKNKILLDIGSSTGGFSDCALKNGIKKVYAIDVGTKQLDPSIKIDPKVFVYENTDFRTIDENLIMDSDLVTIDVSFISINKLLKKLKMLKNIKEIICLIKPQFECGKEIANKYKGIPLNKKIHINIIQNIINSFKEIDFNCIDLTFSPITGGSGNIEYLIYLTKNSPKNIIDVKKTVEKSFLNFQIEK